jgi:DNA-binding response OmpR family regulator
MTVLYIPYTMKVLLVEDDASLAHTLIRAAKPRYYLDWASSLNEAETAYHLNTYTCIIADLNLPDGNGMQLCNTLRQKGDTIPFLVLTADPHPLIQSLLEGADDYITKPFHLHELFARLHAVLRRGTHYLPDTVSLGNIEVDRVHRAVSVNNNPIALRRKEYDVLVTLLNHVGKPVSSTTLIETVWDSNEEPYSNCVEVHICRLRRALKAAHGAVTIKTLKNYGYTLTLGS